MSQIFRNNVVMKVMSIMALQGTSMISKSKISVYEENIKLLFHFQLFTCFEGCRVWFAGYGAWLVGCGVWIAGDLVQFNMTKRENDILCQ